MIAMFCLFLPELLNFYMRRKLLGGNKKRWQYAFEYAISVMLINYSAMFILYWGFRNTGNIFEALNHRNDFAFKYMSLALAISIAEPWIEYCLKRYVTFSFVNLKKKIELKQIHILATIYACALASLNFIRIFDNNFWGDEAFTVNLSEQSFSQMIKVTANDVHPPLYYVFVMLGCRLLGFHGWVYHLVSLIPYLLILVMSLTLIWKTFGKEAAVILITFSSLLQCAVQYNVEVRMYSWGALFMLFSFYELYCILEEHGNFHYPCFLISSLAAAYTHYYALISVAFLYICLIAVTIYRKRNIGKVISTCVLTVMLYLPWLFILIQSFQRTSESYWMTSIPSIWNCMEFIFKADRKWAIFFYCIIFLITVLFAILYETEILKIEKVNGKISVAANLNNFRLTNMTIWIIAGFTSIFGTIAIGKLVSKFFRPMFTVRYLFPVAIVAWLLVGVGISKLKLRKLYAFLLIGVILGVGIPNYLNTYTYEKSIDKKLSETMEALEGKISKEDVILTDISHLNWTILEHYFPGVPHQLITSDFSLELKENQSYWLILSKDIDENIRKWLSGAGKGYVEVYHEGNLGTHSVCIYQLKEDKNINEEMTQ